MTATQRRVDVFPVRWMMKQFDFDKNIYFVLMDNVILVEGAKGGLIQDLRNERIYSIDFTAKIYLKRLIDGESIEDVLSNISEDTKCGLLDFLKLIVDKELGSYSTIWIKRGIIERKVEHRIETVWLELRKSCNLKCCHCYMDCNSNRDKELQVLSLKQWKEVVESLKDYSPSRVILIGGEPLLFKEILQLILFIRGNMEMVDIILYSNLTLVDDKLLEGIKECNVKVITSVYSSEAEIHDKITGHSGSFVKTIENIKKLKRQKVFVRANIVVMKHNSEDVEATQAFLYDITGVRAKVDVVRDVGKEKKYLIPEKSSANCGRVKVKPNFKGISGFDFKRNYSGNSCWQGKINITCDGYISPCIMGEEFINREFNVKTHTLDEILNNYLKPKFWGISRDKIEVCKDCEYRYVCKDCRPMSIRKESLYKRGDMCKYNPYERIWSK